MHQRLLYLGLILLAALVIGVHLYARKKRNNAYKGGARVANTGYIENLPLYKKIMAAYKYLSYGLEALLVIAVGLSMVLIARPYQTETIQGEERKRDIFLCLDVSYSIYDMNYDVVDSLKDVVKGLDGDRFGITIFNTTSLLYVPMTDDYDFIIEKIENLKEIFTMQKEYMALYKRYSSLSSKEKQRFNELSEKLDYELDATIVNNLYRGSSLIGEGLASALYDFPRLETAERTRVIILLTDNLQLNRAKPVVNLQGACDLCKDYGVKVYGVHPKTLDQSDFTLSQYNNLSDQMKKSVESTGGVFYQYSSAFPAPQIVSAIEKEEAKASGDFIITKQVDQPQTAGTALLISLALMIILGVILKK